MPADPTPQDVAEAARLADGAYEAAVACNDCHGAGPGHYVCDEHQRPIARALASARLAAWRQGMKDAAGIAAAKARDEAAKCARQHALKDYDGAQAHRVGTEAARDIEDAIRAAAEKGPVTR